jgi:hypothetical protein
MHCRTRLGIRIRALVVAEKTAIKGRTPLEFFLEAVYLEQVDSDHAAERNATRLAS